MVTITATNYATPSTQAWMGHTKLDQARRDADQAQANARQLRAQADQAEQQAAKGQAEVRAVSAQVAQADSTYAAALRQQIAAAQSRQSQTALTQVATVAGNHFSFPVNPLQTGANPWAGSSASVESGSTLNQTA